MNNEDAKVYLAKAEDLMKQGFQKWDAIPEKNKNIASGVALVIGCLALPKLLFVLSVSSLVTGRHLYLSGDSKKDDAKFEFENTEI